MISAKEARKNCKDGNDFFEKYNIESIITKLSLSGHNHCHLYNIRRNPKFSNKCT